MNFDLRMILCAVLIVVGGYVSMWHAPRQIATARASAEWPTTRGVVLESKTRETHTRQSGTTRYVDVRYRYTVDGRDHVSDVYSAAESSAKGLSKAKTREFAERHRAGQSVDVFYDPQQPGKAVLARGGAGKAWIHLGLGTVALLAGIFYLLITLRRRAR